jgi:hypothetical protein
MDTTTLAPRVVLPTFTSNVYQVTPCRSSEFRYSAGANFAVKCADWTFVLVHVFPVNNKAVSIILHKGTKVNERFGPILTTDLTGRKDPSVEFLQEDNTHMLCRR